ncbi:GNAT family N-acetyltransferase [Paracoccus caeni]|uniref:GNAT family N-acetyltransferase n=1 Tax=Paracoccus caeni TaxID=657651 RepID=A0A934SI06_9RHOB|nr:GNAT family N-acetyltransferase [Paracoccus caeni]MBK4218018.1 GNAT family N-acetyltransferase [Paracoccus caeni]
MDRAIAEAFEATWPAAEYVDVGGFRVGRGLGAGGRVSSARAVSDWTEKDILAAAEVHRDWGQKPMFRVLDADAALVAALTGQGYRLDTPTLIMAAPVEVLTSQPVPPVTAFAIWPPLAIQRDIWGAGNINPARQAVMERVAEPKVALLGRIEDRAAGAGFVAVHQGVAMVHAVEVLPDWRRRGLAGWMMRQAGFWAAEHGADRVGLAVSRANTSAQALYRSLGFGEVAGYGYYEKD